MAALTGAQAPAGWAERGQDFEHYIEHLSDDPRMSTTTDWLAELRESKQQAIARAQAAGAEQQAVQQTAQEQLQAEQSRLAALIQDAQIEHLLQEFCSEILQGHPNFVGYSLTRTVRSRAAGSTIECTEPDPWTGPVENNALSALGNGRYMSAVDWKLQSNYHGTNGHELKPLRILIATTAAGIRLDGQMLSAPTAENFKQSLLAAFKTTLRTFSRRRSHRHHRRWYRRFFKALFPTGKLSAVLVAGTVIIILLSAALAVHIAQVVGVKP
jgi:hypothetical protein